MKRTIAFWIAMTALTAGPFAQGLPRVAEKRVALVIGNGAYMTVPRLTNPPNDAADMSALLKDLGFAVTTLVDADLAAMEKARRDFAADAAGAQIRFFYFAGHGVQAEGTNWLLPVDVDVKGDYELKAKATSAQVLLDGLEEAGQGVNVVVLDACRDNPFKAASRALTRTIGASRGLAVMGIKGSLIVYATAAGQTAADGTGRNGLFTECLLAHLGSPGLSLQEIMTKVSADVVERSDDKQVPWKQDSLTRMVYFISPEEAKARFAARIAEGEAALKAQEAELASLRERSGREASEANRRAIELEIQKKTALEAQRRQETEALKAERERQEAAARAQAEEAAQLARFKAEEAAREEAIRGVAQARRKELEGLSAGSGGASSYILSIEAARSARSEIERQYADSLAKISASVANAYDLKLKALGTLRMEPWENEREFRIRVAAERSRLESEKRAALSDAASDSDAKEKAALAPFGEAEEAAVAGLDLERIVYKGSAVRLEIGEFDRDRKRYPVKISSAVPELAYSVAFFYSIQSDQSEELKRRYLEFEAWRKAGAVLAEIEASVISAGPSLFLNQVDAVRLLAVEPTGEKPLHEEIVGKPVSQFAGSSDRASKKKSPASAYLLVVARDAMISVNGAAETRDRALTLNPKPGAYSIQARLPNGTVLRADTVLAAKASEKVVFDTTGSLELSAVDEGELWIDGERKGLLKPGAPLVMPKAYVGRLKLEMRYPRDIVEKRDAAVSAGVRTQVAFGYDEPMVYMEAGAFSMGSPVGEKGREPDEGPVRDVGLAGFWIGAREVTQEEWKAIMGSVPSVFPGDRMPVENVSWYDCLVFCNRKSLREGRTPCYSISGSSDPERWGKTPSRPDPAWDAVECDWAANGYRLPTEAEWEYACRAGTRSATAFGEALLTAQANFDYQMLAAPVQSRRVGMPAPAGSFPPNAWGLHDMHGNVWEWCWDWLGEYQSAGRTDPRGAKDGTYRSIRGGSWKNPAGYLRSAYRAGLAPVNGNYCIGLRLVSGR